jgi:RNA polymerase sigma-70 factor (ECF subfamily)
MLTLARRFMRNEEDARDVVQEAFLAAFRSIGRFDRRAQLSTWLHRVTVNASLDLVRKRSRREGPSVEEMDDAPTEEPGPEAAAIGSVRAREVHRALGRIAPDQRAVIVLHDLQGLDYAEVAAALEVPVGTVKSRLHRARLALAQQLGHLKEQEPTGDMGPLR